MDKQQSSSSLPTRETNVSALRRIRYSQPALASQYTSYYGIDSYSRHRVMSPPPSISRITAGPYTTNRPPYTNVNYRNQLQKDRQGISQAPAQSYVQRMQAQRTLPITRMRAKDPFQSASRQISTSTLASIPSFDGSIAEHEVMTTHLQQSSVLSSDDYIQMYKLALSNPKTGITLQKKRINGRFRRNIFTGVDAAKWFMDNMDNILTVDAAASVGRKLVALGIIQNASDAELTDFIVSPQSFYSFTDDKQEKRTYTASSIQEHHSDSPREGEVNTTYHDLTQTKQQGWFFKLFGSCCPNQ
ncbi:uncharacterized protein LOC134179307 [Corticium candelabrum]|uniref:uncharacterized protein LOC134179307 n=1 Tax=Corticium candelabrum TaxID=121492 RepID=UPI002E262D7A|nr:uncharacterized protein LOC134179307 [Corticium candelabrum]